MRKKSPAVSSSMPNPFAETVRSVAEILGLNSELSGFGSLHHLTRKNAWHGRPMKPATVAKLYESLRMEIQSRTIEEVGRDGRRSVVLTDAAKKAEQRLGSIEKFMLLAKDVREQHSSRKGPVVSGRASHHPHEHADAENGESGTHARDQAEREAASRKIAYKVWWELTTRKIARGLDEEHDLLSEVYDSWYAAFRLIRDHVRELPVGARENQPVTLQVMSMTTSLLNDVMRPHLSRWQAEFRAWRSLPETLAKHRKLRPQSTDRKFPHYAELLADLRLTNGRVKEIERKLHALALGPENSAT